MRHGALLALLAVAVAVFAFAAAPPARAGEAFVLSTGPEGGSYRRVGEAIRGALRGAEAGGQGEIEFSTAPSTGSVANVRRLSRGDAELAIVQGDVLFHAVRGTGAFPETVGGLRAVAVLYPETLHLLARPGGEIAGLESLRGRRVAVGEAGSGTAVSAAEVLEAAGLDPKDVTTAALALPAALAALKAGEVDAVFAPAPAPDARIAEAISRGDAALVPIDPARLPELSTKNPFVRPTVIAAGAYPRQPAPVPTLSVDAVLVAAEGAPPDLIFEILARLNLARKEIAAVLPAGVDVLPAAGGARLPVPLHRGAMSYYSAQGTVARPVKVETGIFVHDVWNFDIKAGTYAVDFEVWFKWRGRIDAENQSFEFEVVNGVIDSVEPGPVEKFADWTHVLYRARATMRGNFLLHYYPFDRQTLEIAIEHRKLDASEVILVPDISQGAGERNMRTSGADPTLAISDWVITDIRHGSREHVYPSDFGSVEASGVQARFSRYAYEIELRRVVIPYVIKFSVPLVIIVLMAFVCFFMHEQQFDAKVVTAITALLSSVAFHVTQADHLPEVGYLVTSDMFFILSYGVIFLALIEITIENHFVHAERHDRARLVARISRYLFPLLFFGPIAYLVTSAVSASG